MMFMMFEVDSELRRWGDRSSVAARWDWEGAITELRIRPKGVAHA